MLNERVIPCYKCKKLVRFEEIRADANAKDWICISCYQTLYKKQISRNRSSEQKPNLSSSILLNKEKSAFQAIGGLRNINVNVKKQSEKPIVKTMDGLKITMKCFRCTYSFLTTPNNIPLKCPYCGKENTLDRVRSAAAILKEVEEEDRFNKKI